LTGAQLPNWLFTIFFLSIERFQCRINRLLWINRLRNFFKEAILSKVTKPDFRFHFFLVWLYRFTNVALIKGVNSREKSVEDQNATKIIIHAHVVELDEPVLVGTLQLLKIVFIGSRFSRRSNRPKPTILAQKKTNSKMFSIFPKVAGSTST
jgi:hypothetical protein